MTTAIVVVMVSGALIIGAIWGIYGSLSKKLEGFMVALAGGALLVSALLELIDPVLKNNSVAKTLLTVFAGAMVFTVLDYLVKEKWGSKKGGGLLAAITLDGIPENLAQGVSLIGAGPLSVAALSGCIGYQIYRRPLAAPKRWQKISIPNQKSFGYGLVQRSYFQHLPCWGIFYWQTSRKNI